MNDQKIREILSAYVEEGMRQLNEEKMAGADHVYSPKYEKKIKRMLWTEQYFGKHLKLGYALRYAAVFALVVLSMFAANEASARILNVNPWRYIVSFSKRSKMEHNTYQKKPQKSQKRRLFRIVLIIFRQDLCKPLMTRTRLVYTWNGIGNKKNICSIQELH